MGGWELPSNTSQGIAPGKVGHWVTKAGEIRESKSQEREWKGIVY